MRILRIIFKRAIGGRIAFFIFLAFGICPRLPAEPVTIIWNNGPSSNRVDLVVLGDGYTAAEMTKYANDVENFVLGLFNQEPFKEYVNYFNVLRVDVISNESGADKPASGITKDTALDATYYCSEIQRLICVNTSKVYTILARSVVADQRDMILVLVNDSEYGGSGGAVAVASTHPSCVELILHEEGHSFGLLADEYDYSPPDCLNTVEPSAVNVTKETDRDNIKWNTGGGPPTGWIDPSTPIPTIGTEAGIPGLYEGAQYCPTGLYRPTYNSKMRNLFRPFEQINAEQLIKRIYNWVSPLDSWTPDQASLVLYPDQTQDFKIAMPQPLTHSLNAVWYVDGINKGDGSCLVFNSADQSPGIHTVKVDVRDPASSVRYDPASVLAEQHSWTLKIIAYYYTLRVEATAGGTTDPSPGSYSYSNDSTVIVSAIPEAYCQFTNWTGDASGTDTSVTVTLDRDKTVRANFSQIRAPLNFQGKKVLNRSLSRAEYINVLTWVDNPQNVNIAKYRIYIRQGSSWNLLQDLDATTRQYLHRRVNKNDSYAYRLAAVTASGREGVPSEIVVK